MSHGAPRPDAAATLSFGFNASCRVGRHGGKEVINKHEKRTLWIVRAVVFKFNHRINVLKEIMMRRWTVLYAFIVYRYIVLPKPPGRAVRPSAQ